LFGSSLLILLGPLGAVALFGGLCAWLAWCIADIVDAARAPVRWANRKNGDPPPGIFPGLKF
jgi:hypothetical protein